MFPGAAVTKCHELHGLRQQKLIVSQLRGGSWKSGGWRGCTPSNREGIWPGLFRRPVLCLQSLGSLGFQFCKLQSLPSLSHGIVPCCVHVFT